MKLSTRGFLMAVADHLPAMLPPSQRSFGSEQWGRYVKFWYRDKGLHFEVQFLRNGMLEIAFHMESDKQTNLDVNERLSAQAAAITAALGDVDFTSHMPRCFAIREVWKGGAIKGEEAALEAASRLADYIVALRPLIEPPVKTRGRRSSSPRAGSRPRASARAR